MSDICTSPGDCADDFHRLKAERDEARRGRDALAAQVAALVDSRPHFIGCSSMFDDDCDCPVAELMSNLPAAAAKYLAAQRVCEILMTQYAPSLKHAGPLVEAMDEWRKAGE